MFSLNNLARSASQAKAKPVQTDLKYRREELAGSAMFTADKSKIGSKFPHSPKVGDYFFKVSAIMPDRVSLIGSWYKFDLAGNMFRWVLEDGLEWVYTPGGSPEFRQHKPKQW